MSSEKRRQRVRIGGQEYEIIYGTPQSEQERQNIELQIETSTTCNAACHFCVYPKYMSWRAGKVMPMDLFKKIIDEAATIPLIDKVKILGLNEPLLDPMIFDRYAYTREKMPTANLQIYTNGVLLTPERHDKLKAAGCNCIVISLNAVSQEQHERVMGIKGKFDQTCANIDYAISKCDRSKGDWVEVHAVANGDQFTEQDVKDFNIRWGNAGYGGHGVCVWEANWAKRNRSLRTFNTGDACYRALTQIYVMCDGRVSTCCLDPTGRQVFGDLKTQTLREVYNNDPFLKFREDHFNDKADRYSICRGCSRI